MGQSISGERFFSLFSWSTASNPKPRSSRDKYRECDDSRCETRNIQQSKNFNSFSCFKTQNANNENKDKRFCVDVEISDLDENTHKRRSSLPDIHICRKNKKVNDTMPLSKKCYNFCNSEESDDPNDQHQNCNYSCVKRYDIPHQSCENTNMNEMNGNQIESVQSCSHSNANEQTSSTNSTSINRYITAFNPSVEKLSLDDDSYDGSSCSKKSSKLKRPHKSKNNSESNDCIKETKANGKTSTKKKNIWGMRIYGSKLNKGNNNKVSMGDAGPSTLDTETGCVCTSYKKVEFNEPQEPVEPVSNPVETLRPQPQQLSLGWASERVNMNRGGSTMWASRGSSIYSQQNRNGECISCEGSHCHVDVEFSNIGGLPINIAVARVGSSHNSNSGNGNSENNLIFLSLSQNNPVFDISRMNSDDHVLEDCEERARVMRALEIAEGVEPPPGYNSPHIQVVSPNELRAMLLFQQQPSSSLCNHQIHHHARIHTQVDYIHCLVPDLRSITSCSFYWGKMDRYEAERLLEGKDEGTFLLRDSAQEEYLFSVSFRKYQRSLHARIEQFNHKFSFDSHDPGVFASDTVTGLIEHYKDPSCVMFFEPMLTAPLSRIFTFPLQHLCRAVIVSCTTYDGINKLRLPNGIKTYLKEYHYRQRVRVKRFDESPDIVEETQ